MASVEETVGKWRDEAEGLVAAGRVRDIEFSGTTYQIQVLDGDEEIWPFIQLDEEGGVRDVLCSCESEDLSCVHVAAALLSLFKEGDPLHLRFRKSLWHVLTRFFADHEVESLEKEEGGKYVLKTPSHKTIFSIEGEAKTLEAMIEKRVRETEENSLKFSGLSHEELRRWREGRPSKELRYELSFWSDLAKWLMVMQDRGETYSVAFSEGAGGLPNGIAAKFDEVAVDFYLSEANLREVISALRTVESPLHVHDFQDEAIEQITYNKEEGTLQVHPREGLDLAEGLRDEEEGRLDAAVTLDEWVFVPGEGFYSQERHTLLEQPLVGPQELGEALQEHRRIIARHLVGAKVHEKPVHPHYSVRFDEEWNLHIHTYLFDPGDLQLGDSRFFGKWAYLDDDGFYPLAGALFDQVELVVPADEVSTFVHRNRAWLNSQGGFHTHLTTVESQLSYEVDGEGTLHFSSRVELPEGQIASRDFGDWIYIAGQGFYSKAHGRTNSPVKAGASIKADEVPVFIRVNREDLELVDGFFTEICPVAQAGLQVSLTSREHIRIKPRYELFSDYRRRDVFFYDDMVYLAGHGFSDIPQPMRLPERFAQTITLKGQEMKLFLTYELGELMPYIISLDPKLTRPKGIRLLISAARLRRGSVTLDLAYTSDVGAVNATDVWEAISKRKTHLFSPAGLLDLKGTRFQWLRSLPGQRVRQHVRLTSLEFIRLSILEELEVADAPGDPRAEEAREVLNRLTSLEPPEPPDTRGLVSTLRHYQETGVQWLWFLYRNGLSGLLCDDMGLGKTHQAMALLATVSNHFKERPDEERPHYLVVCPTSVIYHWKEKLAQFLPHLKVSVFYGPQRSLADLPRCDVLVTSYGVLRSEKVRLRAIPFEVAIFDEIQVAKNISSQTHKTLCMVKAGMRLGLTGTPIENTLRELKALFDIVLPTYLPSEKQYRDYFVTPIEKEGDEGRKTLLRKVVSPFLLRRKKEEVLTELPSKTEEKAHCDLSSEQRRLYNELLERNREKLLEELQDKTKATPYLHVFALLTGLKQICDHPAVHLKNPASYRQYESGKWELFCELLSQARESRQKVVVFSHYLSMLDIIESYLKDSGVGFAAIRGSTQDRAKELERFEKDPSCEVFVGSLQAVGLGVDLTAASVVIHYDRWWNAARENQATDRVHRIGQTRGVQVFKLLTLNTIEERIDQLITQKGELMEDVVGSDEQGQLKAFTREELIQLLQAAHI